jgi:hypothetical protein
MLPDGIERNLQPDQETYNVYPMGCTSIIVGTMPIGRSQPIEASKPILIRYWQSEIPFGIQTGQAELQYACQWHDRIAVAPVAIEAVHVGQPLNKSGKLAEVKASDYPSELQASKPPPEPLRSPGIILCQAFRILRHFHTELNVLRAGLTHSDKNLRGLRKT